MKVPRLPLHNLLPGLLLMGIGCQLTEVPQPVTLSFQALFSEGPEGKKPFSCKARLGDFTPHHLKFFVHDVVLEQAGKTLPLRLEQDGRWQYQGLALLDFEDGTGFCKNGTPELRQEIIGKISSSLDPAQPATLHFKLGIPFALNHLDPVQAPPPLSDTSMHWSWQGGFKYFRLEGLRRTTDGVEHPYKVHLGSTGCQGTIGNISSCTHNPIAAITLQNVVIASTSGTIESQNIPITLQLNPLLSAQEEGCMSEPAEAGCAPVLTALGLDPVSQRPVRAGEVFTSP